MQNLKKRINESQKDDDYLDEDDFMKLLKKELDKPDFKKRIKDIVADCFAEFAKYQYVHRNFLKNKY
jgi:hypothetical protein